MAISNITTGTLVDQTLLNAINNDLNGVSNKLVTSISPIYGVDGQVNSYFGTFAIATNRQDASLSFDDAANQLKSVVLSFQFGKSFQTTPLIFASISHSSSEVQQKYLTSLTIDKPNLSGCNVIVSMFRPENLGKGTLTFKISIMAIGLTT